MAFYRKEINSVRGGQVVERMTLGLKRAHCSLSYKALLMGHAGVGKSTELTRLADGLTGSYQVIRFSATQHLDPISFQPFDVLLLMMIEVAKRTAMAKQDGGAGQPPSDEILREIVDWFASGEETIKHSTTVSAEAAAGIGPSADNWWGKALGLFANLKGEMKYASMREKKP